MAVSNIRAAMTDSMVTCDMYEKDTLSTKWLQRNFALARKLRCLVRFLGNIFFLFSFLIDIVYIIVLIGIEYIGYCLRNRLSYKQNKLPLCFLFSALYLFKDL